MKTMQFLFLISVLALFAGCATATPSELINARAAYKNVSAGTAPALVPAELHKAERALAAAEQSFINDSDSFKTRGLAYVAQRKSELAGALAATAVEKLKKEQADADFLKTQTAIVKQGKQDLSDSERRTADALAALAQLGSTREEERGLVITLSGSVLFKSGESTLLSSAQTKLDQVVAALMAVRERSLIVEGHTDSQGSNASNQSLSQFRADAVRDYLIHGGYPNNLVQSRGKGEDNPIADNASPEGRANNRRVEIIVERESHSSNP